MVDYILKLNFGNEQNTIFPPGRVFLMCRSTENDNFSHRQSKVTLGKCFHINLIGCNYLYSQDICLFISMMSLMVFLSVSLDWRH